MMRDHYTFNDLDQQSRQELQSFIPDQIFDAHAHIWRVSDLNLTGKSFFPKVPRKCPSMLGVILCNNY